MDLKEIMETPIWRLYEKGRNYHRQAGIYTDTDRNYRFYNGNQWEGAKLGDIEPVQKNFIKPIVKYKVSVIHDNLYAINYSSQNYENRAFRKTADRYCAMLNRYAANIWERDKMDFKGRRVTTDSCVNDEGIIYVDFDKDKMTPVNEIIKKNDVYYGNENDDEIQSQPYILIRKRMPVVNARELAEANGVGKQMLQYIIGDTDNLEESGDAAKLELDNMATVVYKLYKKDETVHFSIATRWAEILNDVDTGLKRYPLAHFNWEEKEGSARGEGEVRYLIPNQIEVNKTEMRRIITVKQQAYPMKVAAKDKIVNASAVNTVGGVVWTNSNTVDDVRKVIGTIPPAQMSPDVVKLQEDLIQVTRELAGAGDIATGQVNPESASGRAILAVQEASRAPMTAQREGYKNFVEDLAHIWLEYLIVHSVDGVDMEEEVTDPMSGQKMVQIIHVSQTALEQLRAAVKVDITPKSSFDKFAQEQSMENLLSAGLFTTQRMPELKLWVKTLDDDSVMPKQKLLEMISAWDEEQKRIANFQAQAQMMRQRAQQFLMEDPDGQASQIADARMQIAQQNQTEIA